MGILIELRDHYDDAIKQINTDDYARCEAVYIKLTPSDDRREHFPVQPVFPAWDRKRKIKDLPEPPAEIS